MSSDIGDQGAVLGRFGAAIVAKYFKYFLVQKLLNALARPTIILEKYNREHHDFLRFKLSAGFSSNPFRWVKGFGKTLAIGSSNAT